ncbi:MAG: hypothetical protein IKV27_07950 [Lachnospiraceae bacterium]|nr:hypothetical protein [Lachnospiraceae bacterium]
MNKKAERLILFLYLAGFLVVACTIALLQPLADTLPLLINPPDEHARFQVPWYIYQHGRIPTGFEEELRIPSYGFSYGLYNVFPYIVQGYVMRFAGIFTDSMLVLLYVARFVNVLSGLLMAVVVYLLSKKLFVDRTYGWAFCFAVTFLPENLFMHTYVNTDSMCLLAVAMMIYGLVCGYREGFARANCAWMCGGIILCALSYYNAYGYILSCILLFLVYFLKKQNGTWQYDLKTMLKKGAVISVVVLLGISWWFIRSYILFDGDFLGLATREKMAIEYASPEVNPANMVTYQSRGISILEMMRETDFLEGAFYTFVAAFGSMTIVGGIWTYRLYKVFFALGILGCVLMPFVRRRASIRMDWKRVFFHLNMIFCMIMPLILLIRYAYTMDFQNQGRYLLPALIPLMYYMVRGFENLVNFQKIPRCLQNLLVAFVIILPVASTLWLTYHTALPLYLETGVILFPPGA